MRAREQLPAEADAEHRHAGFVSLAQHLHLGAQPRADEVVVPRRPVRAHDDDRVEPANAGELHLDARVLEIGFRHDLEERLLVAALAETLRDGAGRGAVVVLDDEDALSHVPTLGRFVRPGATIETQVTDA